MTYRNWRYVKRCPQAVEHCHILATLSPDPYLDFNRVSGLVTCDVCGHEYYDHPRHPHWTVLTITCEGQIVKL